MTIQKFEQFSMDIEQLKTAARKIEHCGDCGNLWLHKGEGKIFWTAGDSDCDTDGEFTSEDQIKSLFLNIPGITSVEIDYECYPNEDEGYEEIEY